MLSEARAFCNQSAEIGVVESGCARRIGVAKHARIVICFSNAIAGEILPVDDQADAAEFHFVFDLDADCGALGL